MFLQYIPNNIDIQPTALLPLFQFTKEGSGCKEEIFDIGENDCEGFIIEDIEHAGVEDLVGVSSVSAVSPRLWRRMGQLKKS